MDDLQRFASDDEDDTLLFDKMQEHVLEHCPNPERIGCLDNATLSAFVEAPGKLDLSDPKYLHILKCAECTRELIEFRRRRTERLGQNSPSTSRSMPGPDNEARNLGANAHLIASAIRESKRRLVQRELQHLEWLAYLSHDLASPLARVLSRLEALEYDSTISSEQKTRLIESARMEITQLAEVISSISQFAMLESDIERQFAETSLDPVLEQAIDAFEFEAGKKGVELDLRIRPNLGLVRIERSLIRRAIENLISNALRFTPEGGLVSVCADRFGNEVQIRVLDTGTGIPAEELPHIFEFAFQGQAQSRPARIGSLGLGLALVRRVAELHHGKVTARNLEPEGAEFVIFLPMAQSSAQ